MNIPLELRYAKTHEWARLEPDGTVTVGVTDHAQEMLGDIVFVELPAVGKRFAAGAECAVVESVKAAADVYAPVSGEVLATNADLGEKPQSINADAYAAWLFKIKPDRASERDALLDAKGYAEQLAAEEH
ncbi:MAG: glycine cleavage system protein GcvH [Betaproteobacteria bacterium]|nr:glycine cleavage system protein GcvH [Betaproteobacteria bacterium]